MSSPLLHIKEISERAGVPQSASGPSSSDMAVSL